MSRWFRLYEEIPEDPKVQRLSPAVFKGWINLLCIASKHDGTLPDLDTLTFVLRQGEDEVAALLADLIARGLIDRQGDEFVPHGWAKRQYKSDRSAERVKRYRNGQRTVTETAPETDTEPEPDPEPEADAEQTRTDISPASAPAQAAPWHDDDWPADAFEAWYALYPSKKAKEKARQVFEALRRAGSVPWPELMTATRRFARNPPEPRFTPHPASWLQAGRWNDDPDPLPHPAPERDRPSRRDGASERSRPAGLAPVFERLEARLAGAGDHGPFPLPGGGRPADPGGGLPGSDRGSFR